METSKGRQLPLPRPKTFLRLMSLETGTELIALSLLFNKLTGVYGMLAPLTGYDVSFAQMSMYLYSILVFVVAMLCLPHLPKQTPFYCLGFAWLYAVDTVINTLYTTGFASSWFATNGLGGSQVSEPRDPETILSSSVPVSPVAGAVDSVTSLSLIIVLTLVRFYFSLVVMAYARQVLLQHVEGRQQGWKASARNDNNPFAIGSPEGAGWKGRLGRAMVSVGSDYWFNREGDEWARSMNARFRGAKTGIP